MNRWKREVGEVCDRGPSRVDSFWRLDHLQSHHWSDIHCDHSRWHYSLHIHHHRLESSVGKWQMRRIYATEAMAQKIFVHYNFVVFSNVCMYVFMMAVSISSFSVEAATTQS